MKHWKWFLLFLELVLVAGILRLPQVGLPEFSCHGGTAPVTAKSRISVRPAMIAATAAFQAVFSLPVQRLEFRTETVEILSSISSEERLALLCTLTC